MTAATGPRRSGGGHAYGAGTFCGGQHPIGATLGRDATTDRISPSASAAMVTLRSSALRLNRYMAPRLTRIAMARSPETTKNFPAIIQYGSLTATWWYRRSDYMGVDELIEELIEREGGDVGHPTERRADVVRDYRGGRPGSWLCRSDEGAFARRSGGDLPPVLLATAAVRPGGEAGAARRHRTVRYRRQHGAGGRRDLFQRALAALHGHGKDDPDLVPDGRVGPMTIFALDAFLDAQDDRRGDGAAARARSAAGRALPSPSRGVARQ